MSKINFLVVMLVASVTGFGQSEHGFLETKPTRRAEIDFYKIDSTAIMSVNINGGVISYGDYAGFLVADAEEESSFTYSDDSTDLDLMQEILEFEFDSATVEHVKISGIKLLFIKDYPFVFDENDQKKIAGAARKAFDDNKPSSVKLNPFAVVALKFEIDDFNEPIMEIDMDAGLLTKGDTLGWRVKGAKYDSYYCYDDLESTNMAEETETIILDNEEIALLVKNGLDYLYINNYHFFFDKTDRKLIAEAAKDAFELNK